MRPDYSDALAWKTRCEAKLGGEQLGKTPASGSAGSSDGTVDGAGAVPASGSPPAAEPAAPAPI